MPSKQTNIKQTLLMSRLRELVQAAFSAIWIQTHEPTEATRDLTTLCRAEGWRLATWDCDRGMTFPLEPIQVPGVTDAQDPLAVIRALPQVANGSGTTLVVFESLHRFLGATEIIQALAADSRGKEQPVFRHRAGAGRPDPRGVGQALHRRRSRTAGS